MGVLRTPNANNCLCESELCKRCENPLNGRAHCDHAKIARSKQTNQDKSADKSNRSIDDSYGYRPACSGS